MFSHLYNQQKTNTEFKKYEEEVNDIKVDLSTLNNQRKVSLNIGAFGGHAKKKKEASSDSPGWDAFGRNSLSFPSYFQDSETTQPPQPKQ